MNFEYPNLFLFDCNIAQKEPSLDWFNEWMEQILSKYFVKIDNANNPLCYVFMLEWTLYEIVIAPPSNIFQNLTPKVQKLIIQCMAYTYAILENGPCGKYDFRDREKMAQLGRMYWSLPIGDFLRKFEK